MRVFMATGSPITVALMQGPSATELFITVSSLMVATADWSLGALASRFYGSVASRSEMDVQAVSCASGQPTLVAS
jgi:hypothetical protein